MYVVIGVAGPGQGPLALGAPAAAVEHSPPGGPASVAASHDEDAYERLSLDAVLLSLQPPVEPAQMELVEAVQGSVGAELHVAGEGALGRDAPVRPRPHGHADVALFHGRKANVALQSGAGVGVVPASGEVHRHVRMAVPVLLDREPRLLPVVVVAHVIEEVEGPPLVARDQLQLGLAPLDRPPRQPVSEIDAVQGPIDVGAPLQAPVGVGG